MKIITPGKLPENKIGTAKCMRCKGEFEFTASEASVRSDPRDGDAYVITCPTNGCGEKCWVHAHAMKDPPEMIRADPEHLVALALDGKLGGEQTVKVLTDAGLIRRKK